MKNQISTIQLSKSVKEDLERLKKKDTDSYEDVIISLVEEKTKEKKEIERLLIQECEETYEDMKRIAKEWEPTLMDGLDPNEKWDFDEN